MAVVPLLGDNAYLRPSWSNAALLNRRRPGPLTLCVKVTAIKHPLYFTVSAAEERGILHPAHRQKQSGTCWNAEALQSSFANEPTTGTMAGTYYGDRHATRQEAQWLQD